MGGSIDNRADCCSSWPEPTATARERVRQLASEFEYWKSHDLGFSVVTGVVKMPMRMARTALRLTCCDSAFLTASTRLIICSVRLFWTITPQSSEEVWRDSVHLGWRDRIWLLGWRDLMIFALDSELYLTGATEWEKNQGWFNVKRNQKQYFLTDASSFSSPYSCSSPSSSFLWKETSYLLITKLNSFPSYVFPPHWIFSVN